MSEAQHVTPPDAAPEFTLVDTRPPDDSGNGVLAAGLEARSVRADLLSLALELSPRVPWVADRGYLNFSSNVGVGGWFLYGDQDVAQYITTAEEPLWKLEVWLTGLEAALYLVIIDVAGFGPLAPGPARVSVSSNASPPQPVDVTGGRQYLGALVGKDESQTLVVLRGHNLRVLFFYRVRVVNIFG